MTTGIIYIATSRTSGKSYIGQTTQGLNTRIVKHKNDPSYNTRFYWAINKYGFDDFIWETLIKIEKPNNVIGRYLNYWERRFISAYDTYNSGYNCTPGGAGGGMSGKKHSQETKKKYSKSRKGKRHPLYGKHHSQKSKDKNAASHCKHIYLVTTPGGKTEIVNNIKKYCRDNNLNQGAFSAVIRGEQHQHKGYRGDKIS